MSLDLDVNTKLIKSNEKQLGVDEAVVEPPKAMIEEYMTITTITRYPDGQKYVNSKTWFKGERVKVQKRKSVKDMPDVEEMEDEVI